MAEEREKRAADYDRASLDRRQFVKVGTTSLGVAGLGACVFGFRYLSPNVLYEPPPIVSVGRPERYPPSARSRWIPDSAFSWRACRKASTR
jgi:hypothetical protein